MAAVRLKWDRKALRDLRTSDEAAAEVFRRAQAIADACGGRSAGYVAEPSGTPKNRARAAVIAASPKARRDNARSNRIVRNIDAGRD